MLRIITRRLWCPLSELRDEHVGEWRCEHSELVNDMKELRTKGLQWSHSIYIEDSESTARYNIHTLSFSLRFPDIHAWLGA